MASQRDIVIRLLAEGSPQVVAEIRKVRDELKAEGILLEDGPSGTTWRRE